jgi:hypothetical protein
VVSSYLFSFHSHSLYSYAAYWYAYKIALVKLEQIYLLSATHTMQLQQNPRFNVPAFSAIPDLVMIFSYPDNSSI